MEVKGAGKTAPAPMKKLRRKIFKASIEPEIINMTMNPDKIGVKWAQDVGGIYKHNAEQRKYSDENWNRSPEFKHAAKIPVLEYLKLEAQGITKDHKAFMRAIEAHPEWKVTTKKLI